MYYLFVMCSLAFADRSIEDITNNPNVRPTATIGSLLIQHWYSQGLTATLSPVDICVTSSGHW